MLIRIQLLLLIVVASVFTVNGQTRGSDFARLVNPFVGTGGHGHTFPGATMPFGMVQLSPDTRIDNWDGSSGYHYSDDIIYGFSHTHLSGTGIPDGCDILLRPTNEWPIRSKFTKFSHANEVADPGFYSVKLDDGIMVELTATTRVGLHRYSFPKPKEAVITLDLSWRDKLLASDLSFTGPKTIVGFRRSTSWAKNQTVYFAIEFSTPFEMQAATVRLDKGRKTPMTGTTLGFKLNSDEKLLVKVAISNVSIEGARKNLEVELTGWDFDKVRADAKAAWNKELSKIEVAGGTPEQTTNFYTALYHTMIQPNVFNDVDGQYKGHDGKIHTTAGATSRNADALVRNEGTARTNPPAPGHGVGGRGRPRSDQYTVFSLWDTFRAAHPLYTIIDQKRTVDFINSFIRMYEQGGRLPVWELWGEETDTMIGYHAVSVIADAMAKDIKGFDYEKAYKAAKHSAELDHHGLAGYKKRGYVSVEDDNESVSKTLEYAYNDWCIMKMGATLYNLRSLNKVNSGPDDAEYLAALSADIDRYRRRSGNFENLFDTETRFFRPKLNGGFVKPFAPQEVTFHFTEGNSWQYSFFVPHDIDRLQQLMGGTTKFEQKLDELFTTETKLSGREQPDITGLIGQYAHGNEPSHHMAYLYNYAAVPSKTQKRVRQIMDDFYKPTPDGLIGNEDCGQMSAWYIFSASGFYPVVPGEKRYDLGSPIFKEITYHLENGKKFTVRAPTVSPTNIYIRSAKWNGVRHAASYITQDHIASGGVLELDMSDTPNDKAFESFSSSSVFHDQAAVPSIDGGGRVFEASTLVSLGSTTRIAKIYYTLDGSEPGTSSTVYTAPFRIDKTTTVKAFVVAGGGDRSLVAEATFQKRLNDWKVVNTSGYSTQYTGGGDNGIVDGIRGTVNFASGEWQGYQGKAFEAVIDLQKETTFTEVGGSFLQSVGSWIWMPDRIVFEASKDGINFETLAEIKPGFPVQQTGNVTREFRAPAGVVKARYVRVKAYNFGKIPAWHAGAGGEPWIFVDEIFIR